MKGPESQALGDVVWRGVEFHREEGHAEARAEILALAEALLPASDVEALRVTHDLRFLRQAPTAALRRQRSA